MIFAMTAEDQAEVQTPSTVFGLAKSMIFDDMDVDSTCLKSDIHFPDDWVLLSDAARTLMKATVIISKHGLKPGCHKNPSILPRPNRRKTKRHKTQSNTITSFDVIFTTNRSSCSNQMDSQ